MKVSKDGQQFFDIDDSEDSVSAAKAKGYKEYIPMTKNGTDVFNVEFSEDSYTAAVNKGYKDLERFNFEQKKPREVGVGEALWKGVGNATGLADELTGVAAGIGAQSQGGNFMDAYRSARDYAREGDKQAMEQQPVANIAGRVAGGVAGAALAPVVNTLKGATVLGGAMSAAESDADLTKPSLESVGEFAIDTGLGAGAGYLGHKAGEALAPLATKAAGKVGDVVAPVVNAVSDAWDNAIQYVKALGRGSKRGAKEAIDGGLDMMFVKEAAGAVGALKGAVQEIKAISKDLKDFGDVAKMARQVRPISEMNKAQIQVIGAGKELADMTDEEAILAALVTEGDNPVKRWFAERASMLDPGQVRSDQYAKLLGMGPSARNAAKDFSPREAAANLKPTLEGVQELFTNARDKRFGQLQDAARKSFKTEEAAPVFAGLKAAKEDAYSLRTIPSSVKNVLADVEDMITQGKGVRAQQLTPGDWDKVGTTEQFNRLQKARELVDKQVNWAKDQNLTQAESILRSLRSDIDGVLKTSPDKVDADRLFSSSKGIEKKFFDVTEFQGGIDESKIARLLGNSDQAHRFRDAIDDLRAFAADPDLDPAFKQQAAQLIEQLDANMGTMSQKGQLEAFRQKQGPSSPAIERMQSITGKNSLIDDATRAPAGFMNTVDEFSKFIQQRLGKPLDKLDPADRSAAIKFWTWQKKNPGAGPKQAEATFKALFPDAENQAAIDQFLKN